LEKQIVDADQRRKRVMMKDRTVVLAMLSVLVAASFGASTLAAQEDSACAKGAAPGEYDTCVGEKAWDNAQAASPSALTQQDMSKLPHTPVLPPDCIGKGSMDAATSYLIDGCWEHSGGIEFFKGLPDITSRVKAPSRVCVKSVAMRLGLFEEPTADIQGAMDGKPFKITAKIQPMDSSGDKRVFGVVLDKSSAYGDYSMQAHFETGLQFSVDKADHVDSASFGIYGQPSFVMDRESGLQSGAPILFKAAKK
jgi:hypothetical protein